jgi:uroporphyrinogen decarboxylase
VGDLFLRACRGEPVERVPVWIMRQAGRYLPQFRQVRARVDFLTLCKTPDLAAEVTVQPVDELGVDAAILFADILLPLEAMGCRLVFAEGEGPSFPEPVRSRSQAEALGRPDVGASLGYVFAAVRQARARLAGRVPLIGFGGTPWTLAAYLVEGGGSKHFSHLLGWSFRDPAGLCALLDRIAEVSLAYLRGQVEAGAQAVQLFDTWGGLLDEERWRRLAMPPLLKVLHGLQGTVPLLYYLHGGAHLLGAVAELPVEVVGVDWRLPLRRVRQVVGPGKVLQGNLDPAALLAEPGTIEREVQRMLAEGSGGGHIANLGHGILPETPVEGARAFVRAVHEGSGRA